MLGRGELHRGRSEAGETFQMVPVSGPEIFCHLLLLSTAAHEAFSFFSLLHLFHWHHHHTHPNNRKLSTHRGNGSLLLLLWHMELLLFPFVMSILICHWWWQLQICSFGLHVQGQYPDSNDLRTCQTRLETTFSGISSSVCVCGGGGEGGGEES